MAGKRKKRKQLQFKVLLKRRATRNISGRGLLMENYEERKTQKNLDEVQNIQQKKCKQNPNKPLTLTFYFISMHTARVL